MPCVARAQHTFCQWSLPIIVDTVHLYPLPAAATGCHAPWRRQASWGRPAAACWDAAGRCELVTLHLNRVSWSHGRLAPTRMSPFFKSEPALLACSPACHKSSVGGGVLLGAAIARFGHGMGGFKFTVKMVWNQPGWGGRYIWGSSYANRVGGKIRRSMRSTPPSLRLESFLQFGHAAGASAPNCPVKYICEAANPCKAFYREITVAMSQAA